MGKGNGLAIMPFSIYAAIVMGHDLTHPELWSDWKHNPHVWGPIILVLFPLLALWIAYMNWDLKRRERKLKELKERNARWEQLLREAKRENIRR